MTTADYLTQLVKDVEAVRTNLNARGVVTEPTETLTTLAPKIGDIGDDLSTEEYMALVDMGPVFAINNEFPTYSEYEINKVDNYIDFYGGELNG